MKTRLFWRLKNMFNFWLTENFLVFFEKNLDKNKRIMGKNENIFIFVNFLEVKQ